MIFRVICPKHRLRSISYREGAPFLQRKEFMGSTAEHLSLAVFFEGCVYIHRTAVLANPLFTAHPAIRNGIVHKLLPLSAARRSFYF